MHLDAARSNYLASLPVAAALRWSLALLLAALPFETTGGLPLPGLTLSSVELPAMLASALWLALLARERRLPQVPATLVAPASLFVGALLLSALAAPEHGRDALKFALRQGQGALLGLCVAERVAAEGWPTARLLLGALAAGVAPSALLGLLELSEAPWLLAALGAFKTQLSFMGGMLRLSGTFVYANVAAMYYEALLPLMLAGALGLARGRWRWLSLAGALLLLGAILMTYSRAALMVTLLLLAALPALALRRYGWGPQLWRALAATGGAAALGLGLLAGSPTLRLRLIEPDITDWYGARYESAPLAQMAPGEVRLVPVRVTNSGRLAWQAGGLRPVMLAYHWLDASGAYVDFEGLRTELPHELAPGESVELMARVRAPMRAGSYRLAWDLVRENGGGWFSQYEVPMRETPVVVAGAPAPTPPGMGAYRPSVLAALAIAEAPPSPPRGALWGAALRMWGERPILGIGPGVFQHSYGPYLGLKRWDTRIHTNNMYIEVLVGGGALGLAGLLALLAPASLAGWCGLARQRPAAGRREPAEQWWGALAAALGLAAFLAHGMLDSFLAFTATNVLLWALIGMVTALGRLSHPAHTLLQTDPT